MHFNGMIDPIYKDFEELYRKFYNSPHIAGLADREERARGAAFNHALKKNIEQLSSETIVDQNIIENDDGGYLKHQEERRGYEIGKAINERNDLCRCYNEKSFMGVTTRKTIFIVKLSEVENLVKNKCEGL